MLAESAEASTQCTHHGRKKARIQLLVSQTKRRVCTLLLVRTTIQQRSKTLARRRAGIRSWRNIGNVSSHTRDARFSGKINKNPRCGWEEMGWIGSRLAPIAPRCRCRRTTRVVGQSRPIGWDPVAPAPWPVSAFLALRSAALARASGQSPGRGYRHLGCASSDTTSFLSAAYRRYLQ